MKSHNLTLSIIASYALLHTTLIAQEANLDPIVVSADFRDSNLSKTSNAVTVIGEEELYDKSTEAFIDVLSQTPNVNFSSGASKAKYLQIRGVGIRSQYETPITPSVGLMVDGIDLSGATLGASLFDTKQIEVLRGPQGTTFGANALGGVVTAQSNEPTEETEGHVETTVGNYNTKSVGTAIGGKISENLLGRISVYKNTSDGYMKNWTPSTGSRNDTNNIDELFIKSQLKWKVSENHTIDLNLLHVDVNNGYDGFSLDNTRTTHSDEPGKDTQKTDAFALKSTYDTNAYSVITKLSHSQSKMFYSYDDDWSYPGEFQATDDYLYTVYNAQFDCPDSNGDYADECLWGSYSGYDRYLRKQTITDLDTRIVSDQNNRILNHSTDWTIGMYVKKFSEDLNRRHTVDGGDTLLDTYYDTTNVALYGQLDTHVNDKTIVSTGLRIEKWKANYSDTNSIFIKNDENMVGGKIGINYQYSPNALYFLTLSKGYKPGGVNAGTDLAADQKTFGTETLWNLDAGLNSSHLNNTLTSRLNLFYGKRKDMQVKLYEVDSHNFTDYLSNASKGTYYGIESQLNYRPIDDLRLYSSVGLLKAIFDEYSPEMEGRDIAQSPRYQYNFGLDYFFASNWKFNTNIEGKGSYYFSDTHNQKSQAYELYNASVEYNKKSWTIALWGRNLTNEEYYVRGFYWGNNPGTNEDDNYLATLYTQLGNPRTFGVTLSYDF